MKSFAGSSTSSCGLMPALSASVLTTILSLCDDLLRRPGRDTIEMGVAVT